MMLSISNKIVCVINRPHCMFIAMVLGPLHHLCTVYTYLLYRQLRDRPQQNHGLWLLWKQYHRHSDYGPHTSTVYQVSANVRHVIKWRLIIAWLMGHVTLVAITGTTVLVPCLLKSKYCNSFEDQISVDFIYGYLIFKWDATNFCNAIWLQQ